MSKVEVTFSCKLSCLQELAFAADSSSHFDSRIISVKSPTGCISSLIIEMAKQSDHEIGKSNSNQNPTISASD